MPDPIRILVVDDHPVVRDGLVAMLGTQPDFGVVAEAATGRDAIQKVDLYRPDILLLDLEMPDMDGVEVLRRARERSPGLRALVFTAFDTDDRILGALRAGAQGYLLKGAPRDELFRAIRILNEGGSLIQPVVASKLLRHVRDQANAEPDTRPILTERQMDVLRLVAQGLRNKEIAARLTITERTVKFHVTAILSRLGATTRTEAVQKAVQLGMIKL